MAALAGEDGHGGPPAAFAWLPTRVEGYEKDIWSQSNADLDNKPVPSGAGPALGHLRAAEQASLGPSAACRVARRRTAYAADRAIQKLQSDIKEAITEHVLVLDSVASLLGNQSWQTRSSPWSQP